MLDHNNRAFDCWRLPPDIERQIKEGKLRFKDPMFYWDDEDDDTRPLEEEDFGSCAD